MPLLLAINGNFVKILKILSKYYLQDCSLKYKPICYDNLESPSCIESILINCPRMFENSSVIETGLSDPHEMFLLVIKTNFQKLKPEIASYRK